VFLPFNRVGRRNEGGGVEWGGAGEPNAAEETLRTYVTAGKRECTLQSRKTGTLGCCMLFSVDSCVVYKCHW